MSHVVSSQPSSTSPYQPTEVRESASIIDPPRSTARFESREDQDGCCFHADSSQNCLVYCCCSFLAGFFGGIARCTESCCDCCADKLNECCEDKPDDKNQRKILNKKRTSYEFDGGDDDTWACDFHRDSTAQTDAEVPYVSSDSPRIDDSRNHYSRQDSGCRRSSGHRSNGHELGNNYCDSNIGTHHSSSHHTEHDSGNHSSSHLSSTHHSSTDHGSSGHHDSGGHHDTGGSTYDSGGGCDSGGGGDSGGGCDSGGGGCDD